MDDGRGGGLFWLNRKQLVVLPSHLILFLCIWFSAEGMINYNLRLTLFTRLKHFRVFRFSHKKLFKTENIFKCPLLRFMATNSTHKYILLMFVMLL